MIPSPSKILYVTAYDRRIAKMGGAAWVDHKVRTHPEAAPGVEDFLVSDPNSDTFVQLELRSSRRAQLRTVLRMLFLREPYIVAKFRQSSSWRRRVQALRNSAHKKTVVTSQWPSLLMAMDARLPTSVHIAHNVDYKLSEIHDPGLFRLIRNSRRTQKVEIEFLTRVNRVFALSAIDTALLNSHRIRTEQLYLGPSVIADGRRKKRSRVGFIGKATWPPNEKALLALRDDVMPKVRDLMGASAPRLVLAGKGTENYADEHTQALGAVESVDLFYELVDLVVVPRGGESSGISVKVIEAWENGVGVIAPPALLHAIGVTQDGPGAAEPDDMASAIAEFYHSNDRSFKVSALNTDSTNLPGFWRAVSLEAFHEN